MCFASKVASDSKMFSRLENRLTKEKGGTLGQREHHLTSAKVGYPINLAIDDAVRPSHLAIFLPNPSPLLQERPP